MYIIWNLCKQKYHIPQRMQMERKNTLNEIFSTNPSFVAVRSEQTSRQFDFDFESNSIFACHYAIAAVKLFHFVQICFFSFHHSNRDINIKLIVVSVWIISLILIKRLIAADVAIESIIISENPMWYGAPTLSGSIIDTSDIHIQIIVSYFVAESEYIWQQNMKLLFVSLSFYLNFVRFGCCVFVSFALLARLPACQPDENQTLLVNLYVAFRFSKMYLCVTLRWNESILRCAWELWHYFNVIRIN